MEEPFAILTSDPVADDAFAEINTVDFLLALRSDSPKSQRAFRRLVEVTHPKLTRFLARYLRSSESVQEAIQEAYLGVHRGLARFEGKCRLTTWIYSLAYRKACDSLAQKYRQSAFGSEYEMDEDGITAFLGMTSQVLAPDEALDQNRLVQEILTASQQLPKIYLDAYQLRDLDGLSGEEAADALGISTALIRVRLHRARALIVESMQNKFPSMFSVTMAGKQRPTTQAHTGHF